ncbi:MAG: PAS domain S-box protein [Coleofasciculus sp. G1-WW12-02]|uniref:PAS domain-containing protein n=1 Tax=Coleofasciculus sp. G1-WW12-02 TaxID=3068483 RepID=UPI0032FBEDA6
MKASEARLNTILSSALAAIFQIRVDVNSVWEFEYVSEGSIHLWGFSPDELIADKTPFLERVVAKDLEAVHEATFEAIFAEGTFGGQYRYNHPDGSLRWISFQFSSTRDAATNSWVVTNVAIDITDKKQAEAVLEHRARVERLLSNISRQFIDQDVDTAINFTLEAIAHFIGCDRSYIFELSDDMNQYYLIREWYAADIPPRSDDGRVET